ncbi:MAG: hypothetical protein IPJ20_20580 [Flammeovirgaceae bacterium]|nr:hypothetical protein [Flammeovirgaceae bacterium]
MKFRFQRVSPVFVSFHNPDVVYYGSQYLHKTTNDGVTWETISGDLTANEPKQVISGSPITRETLPEKNIIVRSTKSMNRELRKD